MLNGQTIGQDVFGKKIVDSFEAKVIGVTDGDTITVLKDKKQIKVRLESIDCPESNQAYGNKAKQAMSNLVFGKTVTVQKTGQDRYKRTLAFVVVDRKNVSEELIKAGWAWQYKQYSKDKTLAELELKSRIAKMGLWADANPVPPWEFRRKK